MLSLAQGGVFCRPALNFHAPIGGKAILMPIQNDGADAPGETEPAMQGQSSSLHIQQQALFRTAVPAYFTVKHIAGSRKGGRRIFQMPGPISRNHLHGGALLPMFAYMKGRDQCKGAPVQGLAFEIPTLKIRAGFVFAVEIPLHSITQDSMPTKTAFPSWSLLSGALAYSS